MSDVIVTGGMILVEGRLLDKCEMDAIAGAVEPCPRCEGRGFRLDEEGRCPLCHDVCVIPKRKAAGPCSSP